MIPSTIGEQSILTRSTWNQCMEAIGDYYDQGYYITDFDYGGGVYKIVMSKSVGWNGQIIKFGKEFPQQEVSEGWKKGYHITNVMHDGSDWIVIMSGVPSCQRQTWFTRYNWNEFKSDISKIWDEGKIVTNLACKMSGDEPLYCAICSQMSTSQGQSYHFIQGRPTAQELCDLCTKGRLIVDIYDFDGGTFVVTASDTGWRQQKMHVSENWENSSEVIQQSWNEGYNITTIAYYHGAWIVILSR